MTEAKQYVKGAELARRLGVSRQTISVWRRKGIISGTNIGGIVLYDLDAIEKVLKVKSVKSQLPQTTSS